MNRSEAAAVLGVSPDTDRATVRRAFREQLRRTHPDLSSATDANERTVRLTTAYRALIEGADQPKGSEADHPAGPQPSGRTAPDHSAATVSTGGSETDAEVRLVDPETIGIAAPASEALLLLVEVAHRLGDITYLDPAAGLLEVVVEFVGAPTSSVVLSLQGRATGMTEVFCTVEPLSGGAAPSDEAVTRLLWRTLRGEDPTG